MTSGNRAFFGAVIREKHGRMFSLQQANHALPTLPS
jgi:hypothetical protein